MTDKPIALTCPVCSSPLTASPPDEDGEGDSLFVANEGECSTEYYDSAVKYDCSNGHYIYLGENSTKQLTTSPLFGNHFIMSEFAKIFNIEPVGQVVVMRRQHEENDTPEIRAYCQPHKNLGVCSVALQWEDNDEGWETQKEQFEKVDKDFATSIIKSVLSFVEEILEGDTGEDEETSEIKTLDIDIEDNTEYDADVNDCE